MKTRKTVLDDFPMCISKDTIVYLNIKRIRVLPHFVDIECDNDVVLACAHKDYFDTSRGKQSTSQLTVGDMIVFSVERLSQLLSDGSFRTKLTNEDLLQQRITNKSW